jgi:N-acetylglucosamine-6-phosphate deacetylase
VLVNEVDIPLERALYAATTAPAKLIGRNSQLAPGQDIGLGDMVRISQDLTRCTGF